MSRRRALVAALLSVNMAAVLCVLALPVQVAHAAVSNGVHWQLSFKPQTLVHDGQRYRVGLTAAEGHYPAEGGAEDEETLGVDLSARTSSAVAHAKQEHLLSFLLGDGGGHFEHASDLSRAHVHGTSLKGQGLHIDVIFAASHAAASLCGGHTERRVGVVSGRLSIRLAGSQIGRIESFSRRAVLIHSDGTCPLQPYKDPQFVDDLPCAPGTLFVIGQSYPNNKFSFIVRKDPDSSTAVVHVSTSNSGLPYTWHLIRAVVPADDVLVAQDLSTVTITGEDGSFLQGEATAISGPTDAPVPWPLAFDCRTETGAGALIGRPEGQFHGTLTAQFLLGGQPQADEWPISAETYLVGAGA